jgi:hypothetical protein
VGDYKAASIAALAVINVRRFRTAFFKSVPAAGEAGAAAGTSYATTFSTTAGERITTLGGRGGRLYSVFRNVGRGLGVVAGLEIADQIASAIDSSVTKSGPAGLVHDALHGKAPGSKGSSTDPGKKKTAQDLINDSTNLGRSHGNIIDSVGGFIGGIFKSTPSTATSRRAANDIPASLPGVRAAASSASGGMRSLKAIVPVPGFPGERADSSVIKMIEAIAKAFGLTLTDAFGPGHKSPGHTKYGTAADFAGPDAAMDAAAKALVHAGYTVGYDGRFGTQKWPGHGPSYVAGSNAHLHVELGGTTGRPTSKPAGGWKTCTLTYYKPSAGGINGRQGGGAWVGHPVYDDTWGCAAPRQFAFGTQVAFAYGDKTITVPVVDRGGVITGTHFDLLPGPAKALGMMGAGRVGAHYRVAGRGSSASMGASLARPGIGTVGSSKAGLPRSGATGFGGQEALVDASLDVRAALAESTEDPADDAAVRALQVQRLQDKQLKLATKLMNNLTPKRRATLLGQYSDLQRQINSLSDTGSTSLLDAGAPDTSAADNAQALIDSLNTLNDTLRNMGAITASVGASQHATILQGLADYFSGAIGSSAFLASQTPATAGVRSRY